MISVVNLMRYSNKLKWSAIVAGHFLFMAWLQGCKRQVKEAPSVFIEGEAMGTTYHIKWLGEGNGSYLKQSIDSLLLVFNGALSTYDTGSLISRFNRNELDFVELQKSTDPVLKDQLGFFNKVCYRSFDIFAASNGAFDPGAAPLFTAWGFAENKVNKIPTAAFVDSCRDFATYGKLNLVNGIPVKQDKRLSVNYNAIAKGYGVDVVSDFLEDAGISDYMVEIGGEVRCKGKNALNQAWTIGVNVPKEEASTEEAQAFLSLQNRSIATSGNYRNFYIEKGVKYSHTIDPRSGFPARNELLSATILAPDCMTADAWATACMVLGKDKCLDLIAKDSTLDAFLLFNKDGKISSAYTPGAEKLLKK